MTLSAQKLSSNITVGMAAHGGAQISELALQCLFSAAEGNYELLLIDDCSNDDTLEVFQRAAREHENTKIMRFPTNKEYVHSVNAILSHASGNRVFFVSNDYLVTPAWLRNLLRRLDENPSIGIVTGSSNYCDNLNDPSRNLIHPSFVFSDTEELFEFAEGVSCALGRRPVLDDPYLVGDAFGVSRALLDRIGTFDTKFIGYIADQDFAIRAKSAGFEVVTDQSAFAYHIRDANLYCLETSEQERRKEARNRRVRHAFNFLLDKYGLHDIASHRDVDGPLPISVFLKAVGEAASRVQSHQQFIPPQDYAEFLVPSR